MYSSAPVSRVLLLGLFLAFGLNAQDIDFSRKSIREAVRLLEREEIEGSWERVQVPAAALRISDELSRDLHRTLAAMGRHERLRLRPQARGDVVKSYELDMQSRDDFNVILREFRQDLGAEEDRFRNLKGSLASRRAELEDRDAAFKDVREILEQEVAPVVEDTAVDNRYFTWPYALPLKVRDALDTVLDQLFEADDVGRRVAKWEHLMRSFQRLYDDHWESLREELREMDMQRNLQKYDLAEFFKELGFSVDYCIRKNEAANVRSAQMRDGALVD